MEGWKGGPCTHEGNHLRRFGDEAMRQLLIVLDEVGDVDIAVEFLEQGILAQLVSDLGF